MGFFFFFFFFFALWNSLGLQIFAYSLFIYAGQKEKKGYRLIFSGMSTSSKIKKAIGTGFLKSKSIYRFYFKHSLTCWFKITTRLRIFRKAVHFIRKKNILKLGHISDREVEFKFGSDDPN